MRNDKFYKIIIIALLLLNMGVLGYLWFGNNRHPEPGGPHRVDELIINKLHLDDKQQHQFQGLKEQHHSQMIKIQQEEGRLHKQLFALLKNDSIDDIERDRLMVHLQENDKRKEEVTFEQFRKLRGILQKEQQPDFDMLVEEIASQIMGRHRDGPPPPGRP